VIVDRDDDVPAGIENAHQNGDQDRRNSRPAHAPERKRREAEKDRNSYGKRGKPAFKSESRQWKEWEARADRLSVGVIEGKKVVHCFVQNVNRNRDPESEPRETKPAINFISHLLQR